MNKSLGFGIVFLILICVSCFKDPGFSVIPAVTFKSISFIKNSSQQSIEVKLGFTDGDGDLGLGDGDTNAPFNHILVYDSLLKENIETNPDAFNYNVVFLFKNANGSFKTCEESPDICDSLTGRELSLYQGRFEDLNPDRKKRPLTGELTYDINSSSWVTLLGGKTIKLKIFIKDRALNQSNTIETDTLLIQ